MPLASRADFGTALRDAAAVLALMGEGGASTPQLQKAFEIVTALRAQQRETTTQESLWLLLAARTLEAQNKDLTLEVNSTAVNGAFQTVLSGGDLNAASIPVVNVSALLPNATSQKFETAMSQEQFVEDGLVVKNAGREAVPASVLVTGDGLEPEPSAESGFKIERKTYAPDGREIDFGKLKQNDRVVVVLKITEVEPKAGQIVVEDRLQAGFDIENPALLKGTDLKGFSWLTQVYSPVFSAFRDDRFVAAYTMEGSRKLPAEITMAYVMRAVTPGGYTHAGARVEDMYRPGRFARTASAEVKPPAPNPRTFARRRIFSRHCQVAGAACIREGCKDFAVSRQLRLPHRHDESMSVKSSADLHLPTEYKIPPSCGRN